ncbi:transglycosylase domain-containing protein [Lysinibacillus sp. KU-BSD001]|uniref:transglycosylase domain-containing protein n=1 Tax=Lysinibacillus sp. KU-BSD001 TaxID=3141328 RepID=UPI0036EA8199
MKQIFGYFLILCSIPLLLLFGSEVWKEIVIAKTHEEKMEASIHLPQVQAQLPVTLLDRNDHIFNEEYVEWREPLPFEEFPQIVKDIFVYSEDTEFFNHIGFDVTAIARAVMANSAEQSIQQGASTITQQLVRMRYLSEEKTYERKLMELFYAYELEQMYSKDEILEMYLNEMYFGNQVYGMASAATYYFGRPLAKLTIAEISFIAAIPNNPSLYDPLKNFDKTKERQERLLDTLAKHAILSTSEAENFKAQPIELQVKQKIQQYPAYSTYVLQELRWLVAHHEGLEEQLTKAKTAEDRQLISSQLDTIIDDMFVNGIIIHTALQPEKQAADEQAMNHILSPYDMEASATVIDNETREIISIFAGRNYEKHNLHRAYQTPRQPGSAFKPLIDYAPAIELLSYTPSSTISGGHYCVGNFCPENYGGSVYGHVSLSTAFSWSYNTSALRLLKQVGLEPAFSYIDRFHFRSIVDEDRNYAAALGGLTYGVTSLEMADAYTSFIDGSYSEAHAIRKVTDLDGNMLYEWPKERDTIWSAKTVRHMRSLLTDVVYKGTGKGLYTNTSYIGAKTGTTNDFKDFWLAGLTENYTTAIWIGYDEPRNMQSLENDKIHFKLFNAIMD